MIQEIHLSDETLRESFIQHWENNEYSDCISILEEEQLENKEFLADIFNTITSYILNLENNSDPSFKANRIIVSAGAPSGLSSGSVWFQII